MRSNTREERYTPPTFPDNTVLSVRADKIYFYTYKSSNQRVISIRWTILDGEFEGHTIYPNLRVFDEKPHIREGSIRNLMQLSKVSQNKPLEDWEQTNRPVTNLDLQAMEGTICSIVVGLTPYNKQFIKDILPLGIEEADLETEVLRFSDYISARDELEALKR